MGIRFIKFPKWAFKKISEGYFYQCNIQRSVQLQVRIEGEDSNLTTETQRGSGWYRWYSSRPNDLPVTSSREQFLKVLKYGSIGPDQPGHVIRVRDQTPPEPSPLRLLLGTYPGWRRSSGAPLATSGLNSSVLSGRGPGGCLLRAESSGLAGWPQAAASRARSRAQPPAAQPGSPGSRTRAAAGPRGHAPFPAALPVPRGDAQGPQEARAIREASMTLLALGGRRSRRELSNLGHWRTASSSTPRNIGEDRRPPSWFSNPNTRYLIRVASDRRQGRKPSRRFCDTVAAGLTSAPGGGGTRRRWCLAELKEVFVQLLSAAHRPSGWVGRRGEERANPTTARQLWLV